MAKGEWLLFLGADDTLYEDDTLSRVAAFIGDHRPSDLVYGDVIMRYHLNSPCWRLRHRPSALRDEHVSSVDLLPP